MLMRRRRKHKLRAVRYRSHPSLKWTIAGHYVNGRRVRKFFESKNEAENFIHQIAATTENLGTRAMEIDQRLHVMAIECNDLLAPHGKTLVDATQFYCRHLSAVQRSCTLDELVKSFLESKESEGMGYRYLKDLRNRLKHFQKTFGQQIVATITTLQCDSWLKNLALAPRSRNAYRLVLNTFFSFAVQRGYCTDNPITATGTAKAIDKPPEVFTPEQIRSLLGKASDELIPFIAIGAFAGLRTAELYRLDWKEIHLDRNFIEISAAKSKTASRRLVTILPDLHSWLAPLAKKQGSIIPVNLAGKLKATRKAAGIEKWPANGLRHSFASYHLAKFQDAAALALQMGHTTTAMLFKHYREVVTPEAAEAYWRIVPRTGI